MLPVAGAPGGLPPPLVTGAAAEAAWAAVEAIAGALRAADAGPSPSVGSGSAGIALFFAYLAEARPDGGFDDPAVDHLERAIEAVGERPSRPHLYAGFPGVAWTVEHLRGRLLEDDDPGGEIEGALLELLAGDRWTGSYDLIGGLVGLGVYALECSPSPAAGEILRRTVHLLATRAEERPEGLSWRTPPEELWPQLRPLAPEGSFNLGVAHGVPGVIAFLAEAAATDPAAAGEARALLDGAVPWLLAQRRNDLGTSLFPDWVGPGIEPEPSRLAWCYGDLGIALALLTAARRLRRADWEEEALSLARTAALRPPGTSKVRDAGLCHGAAGIAHLFHRLYRATGDEELADVARSWVDRALELRRPDAAEAAGTGGFLAWHVQGIGDPGRWRAELGFLTGAAGVGLALLAALGGAEPEWDRLLLTAVRR